ncbi:flagellar biosynthetic protein FliO [Pseudalkalibacillus sp. SCS-8]|uniref:flagellar biosynthetic protein FliO n=1 Tax=Pseudalkalibacillus nanhaiensis TaxID=3115291 RepID=UPI0032DB82B0
MSFKLRIVLLLMAFMFGGATDIYANTSAPEEKCKTVYECSNQDGEGTGSEEIQETPAVPGTSNASTIGTTFKVLFALAFVVALMIIILKLLHKRTQVIQQGKGIQTLGGAIVGNQRSVQLVKVGNRILVVGVGENVELIKEIDDEDEVKSLLSHQERTSAASSDHAKAGLLGWLDSLTNKEYRSSAGDFKNVLRKQLEDSKQERKAMIESMKKEKDNG